MPPRWGACGGQGGDADGGDLAGAGGSGADGGPGGEGGDDEASPRWLPRVVGPHGGSPPHGRLRDGGDGGGFSMKCDGGGDGCGACGG